MAPVRWLLVIGAGIALLRTELPIRLIRTLDQWLSLFAPRGAGAYAAGAPRLLAGLYRSVVDDARRYGAPSTIVDIGCGPGTLLERLAEAFPSARLVGIEPSVEMRAIAGERLRAARRVGRVVVMDGSAESLPLPDGSADQVVSTLSAHHWSDPTAAFTEIRRCLSVGGRARIYDVRFAAFSARELHMLAAAAGFDPALVRREVLHLRIGPFRPFAVATLTG